MAFLTKRKNHYWYIGYDEKRFINNHHVKVRHFKSTFTKSKMEANKILLQFNQERNLINKPKEILCSDFVTKYIDTACLYKKPKHKNNIRKRFEFMIKFLGDRYLNYYDTEDFDKLLFEKSKVCSIYTVKGYLSDLRCAFNQAVKWQYINYNPLLNCQKVILPEPEIIPFTKDEFRKFISVIDNEVIKDIAVFTLYTGLRIGDIVNIRLTDINLPGRYIKIISTNERRPKNQKTNFVEIADELFLLIEKYLMQNKEYLFETRKFIQKFSSHTISNQFKKYVHLAGINKKLNFKALRKTFACWLLESDVDILTISKLLHHSSPRVTIRHYAKVLNYKYSGVTNKIKY